MPVQHWLSCNFYFFKKLVLHWIFHVCFLKATFQVVFLIFSFVVLFKTFSSSSVFRYFTNFGIFFQVKCFLNRFNFLKTINNYHITKTDLETNLSITLTLTMGGLIKSYLEIELVRNLCLNLNLKITCLSTNASWS